MTPPNAHELHARNLRALFAPVASLIDEPGVSEIMINGPAHVYVERAGRVEEQLGLGQGRRGGQQCANGGGSGEDVEEAPSESATGRVNHAEYLDSVVGGVATRL